MKYFCNNEIIDLASNDMNKLTSFDGRRTKEGTCYQKGDEVFKIYYDNLNILLDEETCYKLTKIKLNHIFLPTGIILDENKKYSGYKTDYIVPLKMGDKKILEKSVDSFLDGAYEVVDEVEELTYNRVLVDDFGIHNMIDNGSINIFDVGGYRIVDQADDDYPYSYIDMKNSKQLNILIREMLVSEMGDLASTNLVAVLKYLDKKASNIGYIRMIEKNAKGYDSVQEYARDICTKVKKR